MFQPGISGNTRGRPRGSVGGRAQALAALDRMLSKECNQQALFDALEKELQADPARFFRNVVVPLIPRSTREALPPDANDDWLPLDRTPPSGPPLGLCSPPKHPPAPPTPEKESSSGIQGLQPSVLRPSTSSRLSFACYLLLLIPFALKPHPMPHPTRALVNAATDRLSRIVHTAGVAVKGLAVRDTLPCQPARKDTCYLQMNGGGPVLLSAARPFNGRANPVYPGYLLLLIPSFVHPLPRLITSRTLELAHFRTSSPVSPQPHVHFKLSNVQTLTRLTLLRRPPLCPCYLLLLIPSSVLPLPRLITSRTLELAHFRTSPHPCFFAVHPHRFTRGFYPSSFSS